MASFPLVGCTAVNLLYRAVYSLLAVRGVGEHALDVQCRQPPVSDRIVPGSSRADPCGGHLDHTGIAGVVSLRTVGLRVSIFLDAGARRRNYCGNDRAATGRHGPDGMVLCVRVVPVYANGRAPINVSGSQRQSRSSNPTRLGKIFFELLAVLAGPHHRDGFGALGFGKTGVDLVAASGAN